jgi:hypothetical protein
MSETGYSHPKIPDVLEAFSLLLNDSMALDYCGITGKERKLILNDPVFAREARKIKAERYIEEIKDINGIIKSLGTTATDENSRIGNDDEDITKKLNLKMKVTSMRREMLSLSSNDKETEESDSLNIFFIDVTREEFERMLNVELHDGDENTKLVSDSVKESPSEILNRKKNEDKARTSVPSELSRNVIEYVNEEGETVIEEVQE